MPIGVQNFKLGATVSFNPGNSIQQITRVGKAFGALQNQGKNLRNGLLKVGAGFATLRFLPTGFSNSMRGAVSTAMNFEQQMSAVASVAKDAVGPNFTMLTEEAKRLGIVSAFSAQEAAEGMEFLGRAGFDTSQIITAIGPVLNAAAADSIDLGTSADIVANVLRGMGMEVEKAGHVANVLALTSARTNTNITGLGDAFTYAASTGRDMGFSVDETASALGWLANAGLKGSVAGTSFTNMMVKLTKPSQQAAAFMEQYKIKLTDAGGKMKDMADIVEMFIGPLNSMNDDAERAAMVAEIFGLRGKKAYSAFSAAGVQSLRDLTTELQNADQGIGAAGRMAAIRLDNLAGAITLFKSSMQALSIETVAGINLPLKEGVQAITNFVNTMIYSIKGVSEKEFTDLFKGMEGTPMLLLDTARVVGAGIKDFFTWFTGAFDRVKTYIAPVIPWIESLSDRSKKLFGGIMIGLPIIAGLATPLIALLGLAVPALGAGFAIISGAFGAAIAAVKLLAIPVGGLILLLSRFKKEGESWGSLLIRVFTTVKDYVVGFATSFWATFEPFVGFFREEVTAVFTDLVETLSPAFRRIGDMLGFATGGAGDFGSRVGWLLGVVSMAITTTVRFTAFLIKLFTLPARAILALGEYIGIGLAAIVEFFINTGDKIAEVWRHISAGASNAFNGIVTAVGGALSSAWNYIVGVGEGISNWFAAKIETTKGIVRALVEIWRPYFEPVFAWIGAKINTVVGYVQTAFGFVVNLWVGAFTFLKNIVVGYYSFLWNSILVPIGAFIGERIQNAINNFVALGQVIGNVASTIWGYITTGATMAWNFLVAGFYAVGDTIAGILSGAWSIVLGMIDVARGVLVSAWNGIKSAISGMVEFVRPIANQVVNFLLLPIRTLAGAIAKVLGFAPVVESLKLLGWDVAGVAAQMQSFATKGIALAEGGFLKRDAEVSAHKNEIVMPIGKFTEQFMPRVAEATIPATIERIKETTIIQERARAVMPEIRPQVTVNIPEQIPPELNVRNVVMLDGNAIARAIGRAEIAEGYRTGRTRQISPGQERSIKGTGFRR